MFVVAISGIVIAGITKALIDLSRTSRVRNLNAAMQGEGRDALQYMERDVRQASLGSTAGVIWAQDPAGAVVRRPAVQIFDNVTGGGGLDVKPGTDAILVVGARQGGGHTVTQGAHFDATQTLAVTDVTGFGAGEGVLAGSYEQAAWTRIQTIVPTAAPGGGLNLTATQNVYPKGKLDPGAMVRSARARLYYVSTLDELVQLELLVPRAPASAAEILGRNAIARGFENLQIDCDTDDGVAAAGCPAPGTATPPATEAVWALGAWAGGGSRLEDANVGTLRTVVLMVAIRSASPMLDQAGEDKITLGNQVALSPGLPAGLDPNQPYLRRAYRLPVAVRNVSLGAL
jgi:hypothetical protein